MLLRGFTVKIIMVTVHFELRGKEIGIDYFPDKAKCDAELKDKLDSGELHNPSELE
jgi:hypothetical protein